MSYAVFLSRDMRNEVEVVCNFGLMLQVRPCN